MSLKTYLEEQYNKQISEEELLEQESKLVDFFLLLLEINKDVKIVNTIPNDNPSN